MTFEEEKNDRRGWPEERESLSKLKTKPTMNDFKFRVLIYGIILALTLVFCLIKGWEDSGLWWVILGVCIVAAEVFTRFSIWKRNKQ